MDPSWVYVDRLPGIPCQDLPRRVQNGSERLGVSVATVLRNFFEVPLMVEAILAGLRYFQAHDGSMVLVYMLT